MRTILKTATLLVGVAACHPSIAPAPKVALPEVTVEQVMSFQALVGQSVVVAGRCLTGESATRAVGARPMSSDLWQLEDNGVAVWVSGRKPAACGENAPETVITAEVVQDSLPLLSRPRTLRQYLVIR